MRPADDIEKKVGRMSFAAGEEMRKRMLDEVLATHDKCQKEKLAHNTASVWRIIMTSRVARIGVAAVILIAIVIGSNFFGGSVMTSVAFAEITEAMKSMPWMYMTGRGMQGAVSGVAEQWFGFEAKVHAAKWANGKASFWAIKEHERYEYDAETRKITVRYTQEDDFPLNMSSPVTLLESMYKMFKEQGAQITIKEAEYNGEKAQIQEICLTNVGNTGATHTARLYIQPRTKLLLGAQVKGVDANGNVVMDGEIVFSYPECGPANIYDLGVPRDAEVVSNLPDEDYLQMWERYKRSRANATKEYAAVITHADQGLGDVVTMMDVDRKSGRNHRLERHSVFNRGEQYDKYWPEYEKQLGDSCESLLAWSENHFNGTGFISVHFYDGQHNFSTNRKDTGSWRELRKTPSGSNLMSLTYLGCLGWPNINQSGRIIDDEYARQNNYICIERLQQGIIHSENVSLPGRFLYYLDPARDYICRRKVTEWRPDAEWHEDKNWLEGVEPEKVRDGSITVEDVTELIQIPDGKWYPRVIEVKQSGIRKDYKDAPLKISTIKSIYLRIDGKFPEGIFDPDNLQK